MKTTMLIAAAAMIGACALAYAINAGAQPENEKIAADNFNRFLDKHPNIAADFAKNPNLANDDKYIGDHPGYRDFIQSHPFLRDHLRNSSGTFTSEEGHHYSIPGSAQADAAAWSDKNSFFLQHDDVAREVQGNPTLLDDQKYVAAHPGMKEYLDAHPNLRERIREHPYEFFNRGRGRAYGGN